MISCKPPQRLANFVICGIFTYGTDVDYRYLEINDRRNLKQKNFKTTNKWNYNYFQITCLLNKQTYLTITYLTFESITHKNKFVNKLLCLFTIHKFILVIFPSLDPLNVANPVQCTHTRQIMVYLQVSVWNIFILLQEELLAQIISEHNHHISNCIAKSTPTLS